MRRNSELPENLRSLIENFGIKPVRHYFRSFFLLLALSMATKLVSVEEASTTEFSLIFVQATPGSYNQQAIELLLQDSKNNTQLQFCGTPLNTFHLAYENKKPAFVAIKNTIIPGNFVEATLQALQEFQIAKLISVITMKIELAHLRHRVAVRNNLPLTHIASHPAALQQISNWKKKHPLITEIPIQAGTAEAARQLSLEELLIDVSVIGPKNLVQLYPNLIVIEEGIQDCAENYTTFVLVELDKRAESITEEGIVAEIIDHLFWSYY